MGESERGVRDQRLGPDDIRSGLCQDLPELVGLAAGHLIEGGPEVTPTHLLRTRRGDLQLGALIAGHGGLRGVASGGHVGLEPVLLGLNRHGAVGAEELVDVISQQVGIGGQQVVGLVVLDGCIQCNLQLTEVLAQLLQLLEGLGALLGLGEQGVFDGAGIPVQQGRGLATEMLQDLKTFVADVCQVLVGCRSARAGGDVVRIRGGRPAGLRCRRIRRHCLERRGRHRRIERRLGAGCR